MSEHLAISVLRTEARALAQLAEALDLRTLQRILDLFDGCVGKVVTTGVGKSGHVANRMAATLCSVGTPSVFIHSYEALHGDAGVLSPADVLVALSNSGETPEVLDLCSIAHGRSISVVAITAHAHSSLANFADLTLLAEIEREADPDDVVPTVSLGVAGGLADAIAVELLARRDAPLATFAENHPGGTIGRLLRGGH